MAVRLGSAAKACRSETEGDARGDCSFCISVAAGEGGVSLAIDSTSGS